VERFVVWSILCLFIADADADMSKAELLGATAGRVLGAAHTCGIPPERLQATARLTFAAIDQVAKSDQDRTSANDRMRDALTLGREDIDAQRTSCQAARSALGRLEKRVTKRP
jgi:hypothetical protein